MCIAKVIRRHPAFQEKLQARREAQSAQQAAPQAPDGSLPVVSVSPRALNPGSAPRSGLRIGG